MMGAAVVSAMVVSGHGGPSQHPGGTKTLGDAAGNRLGVGLGGDRRVRRVLSPPVVASQTDRSTPPRLVGEGLARWLVLRFQPLPVEPCMRFSRTRLTDVLHRRCSTGVRVALSAAVERAADGQQPSRTSPHVTSPTDHAALWRCPATLGSVVGVVLGVSRWHASAPVRCPSDRPSRRRRPHADEPGE
jgi:hypothetical protein